ncbi:phosphatase 2C-like domain-containing protein [Mrakia frigida]|uniref:type 2C protein phosphatase PTC5 n=1 Tax=Mrakia frigida TaxID=29902 RepID=UPI003FCC0681
MMTSFPSRRLLLPRSRPSFLLRSTLPSSSPSLLRSLHSTPPQDPNLSPPPSPSRPSSSSFLSSLQDPALLRAKKLRRPPPPTAPSIPSYQTPDDWKAERFLSRAAKRIRYTFGGQIRDWTKATSKERRNSRIRTWVTTVILTWGTIKLVAILWEEMYGVEPVYTSGTYKTRIKLPTKEDPEHIREDVWKIVTRKRAEFLLKRREASVIYDRPGNPVKRCDTSALQSNEVMEDRSAEKILEGAEGDLCFFAVFDGHSGHKTSEFVSKTLLPTVNLALSTLHGGSFQSPFDPSPPRSFTSVASGVKKWLFDDGFTGTGGRRDFKAPEKVEVALKRAFEALDESIVWEPVRLLARLPLQSETDLSDPLSAILPALSGSCALLTYVDVAAQDLYVALAGDCRAVAGYWVEKEKKWRVEVLSEDQTGRNPKELARIQSEHPESEKNDVVRRGRILGGLEPSRAFGDARYKWPAELQPKLYEELLPPDHKRPRAPSPNLKTPPYVTARPEVTHRKLALGPEAANSSTGELRFLVMGTDGLFDRLSNEAIVGMLGQRLDQPYLTGKVLKKEIMEHVLTGGGAADGAGGFDGKRKMKKKDEEQEYFWYGRDENAATFLIRNSLAGGDEEAFLRLMSVKPPISRYQRDDTTVKVVFFGNEQPPPVTVLPEPAVLDKGEWREAIDPFRILRWGESQYRD